MNDKLDYTKYIWNLLGFLFVLCAGYTFYYTYINLNKGLIFNDEAYYLFPFKNEGQSITFDRTNYYRIFKFLYTDNIFHFRLITISLLALSNFSLLTILAYYFKTKVQPILLGFLAVIITFITWRATNIAMEQYISNPILINFSLVFILLSLITNKKYFVLPASFLLGLVLFNGNSHTIVIIPIFLFILFGIDKAQWKKYALYFFLGGALGILLYFTTMDTLENYLSQWKFLREYMSFHSKQHPKIFYVKWIGLVLAINFLPIALIVIYILKQVKEKGRQIKITNYILVALVVISIIVVFVDRSYFIHFLILITNFLVFRYWLSDNSNTKKWLLVVLALLPYGLCFGSMTWFHLRTPVYQIYYYIIIAIVVCTIYSRVYVFALFTAWVLFLTIKFPNFQYSKGWKNFVFAEQTEKILINNYPHYLDKERVTKIEALRPYLQNQENVIYSNNKLLGYLYVLDAHPPIHYYFTLKDYLDFIIEKKGLTRDDMIYIDSKTYPFFHKELVPLQYVENPQDYKVVHVDEFTLYLPKNYIQK